eukprot:11209414-Lingulodinium_polyedra.AAC.1
MASTTSTRRYSMSLQSARGTSWMPAAESLACRMISLISLLGGLLARAAVPLVTFSAHHARTLS